MQTSQSPAATASQQAREPPRQGQGDRERAAANTIAATDQPGRKLAHLRPFDGTFGIPGAAPPEHAPRRGRRISFPFSFTHLLTLQNLVSTRLFILGDLHSNTLFFDPIPGGHAIFCQHLFWVFWTARSLHLNNSCVWDHFHYNVCDVQK